MIPVVFPRRAAIPGGLWTSKLFGDFEEGDPGKTKFYFLGRVDVKLCAGNLRLFFSDVTTIRRSNKSGTAEDDEKDRYSLVSHRRKKEKEIPKLRIFLTKKKPKSRMIDIHTTGTRVNIHNNDQGSFGITGTLGSFDIGLKDIPDVLESKGLVIVKLPADLPVTDEPVIYGIVKFQSSRALRARTNAALKFTDIENMVLKKTIKGKDGADRPSNQPKVDNQSTKPADTTKEEVDGNGEVVKVKINASGAIKSIEIYRKSSVKVWQAFEKDDHEKVLAMNVPVRGVGIVVNILILARFIGSMAQLIIRPLICLRLPYCPLPSLCALWIVIAL